jgi:hypothetical protein
MQLLRCSPGLRTRSGRRRWCTPPAHTGRTAKRVCSPHPRNPRACRSRRPCRLRRHPPWGSREKRTCTPREQHIEIDSQIGNGTRCGVTGLRGLRRQGLCWLPRLSRLGSSERARPFDCCTGRSARNPSWSVPTGNRRGSAMFVDEGHAVRREGPVILRARPGIRLSDGQTQSRKLKLWH